MNRGFSTFEVYSSTGCQVLWEQGVGGSIPPTPTSIFRGLARTRVPIRPRSGWKLTVRKHRRRDNVTA